MNYKTILILLALCICIVPTVSAYETGTLAGTIRCAENTFTDKIGIRNDLTPNASWVFFPILSDGTLADRNGNAGIELIPGNFTLFLPDGNGAQPEYSHARISAGFTSHPERELLGHAISTPGKESPIIKLTPVTICYAFYLPNELKCTIRDAKGKCYPVYLDKTLVTAKVRQLLQVSPSFEVSNEVLGVDPAYGWQKRLDVVYVTGEGSCRHLKDWHFATAPEWTNYNAGIHGTITFPQTPDIIKVTE